jgi:hypothetical protein
MSAHATAGGAADRAERANTMGGTDAPPPRSTTLGGVDDRASELTSEARIALDLLQEQGSASVDALRAAGVTMPAQALYALQLAGWPVVRRGSTWRLTDPNAPVPPKPAPIPRVRRVSRDA